jgi:hypothetical protein
MFRHIADALSAAREKKLANQLCDNAVNHAQKHATVNRLFTAQLESRNNKRKTGIKKTDVNRGKIHLKTDDDDM